MWCVKLLILFIKSLQCLSPRQVMGIHTNYANIEYVYLYLRLRLQMNHVTLQLLFTFLSAIKKSYFCHFRIFLSLLFYKMMVWFDDRLNSDELNFARNFLQFENIFCILRHCRILLKIWSIFQSICVKITSNMKIWALFCIFFLKNVKNA